MATKGDSMDKANNLQKKANRSDDQELINRREFFIGLKKWSKIVIGSAVIGGAGTSTLISPGCGGGSWVNGGGGWIDGGYSGWGNGVSGWVNRRGGWVNRGGGWVNRSGGSAGRSGSRSWANAKSGGGWANRRGGAGGWSNHRSGTTRGKRR